MLTVPTTALAGNGSPDARGRCCALFPGVQSSDQEQKFDADGDYARKYVPELRDMPNKYLFNPWDAPADILARARVRLGSDYPKPIVDVKASRQRALDAFAQMPKLNPNEAK